MPRGLRRGEPQQPSLPKNHPDPLKPAVRMERGLPQDSSLGPMRQEFDEAAKGRTARGPGPVDSPFSLKR